MFRDRAQRPARFAEFHSAILALAYGIEPYDDFAAIAKDVYMRPVPAFTAQEHVRIKAVNFELRHPSVYPICFGYSRNPFSFAFLTTGCQPPAPKKMQAGTVRGSLVRCAEGGAARRIA